MPVSNSQSPRHVLTRVFDAVAVAAGAHIDAGRPFGIVRSTHSRALLDVFPERPFTPASYGGFVVAGAYAAVGCDWLPRYTKRIFEVLVVAIAVP